jgi:hypothetical protein
MNKKTGKRGKHKGDEIRLQLGMLPTSTFFFSFSFSFFFFFIDFRSLHCYLRLALFSRLKRNLHFVAFSLITKTIWLRWRQACWFVNVQILWYFLCQPQQVSPFYSVYVKCTCSAIHGWGQRNLNCLFLK